MLEFCRMWTETYYKGKRVGISQLSKSLLEEEQDIIPNEIIYLTWKNVENEMQKLEQQGFDCFDLNFGISEERKGRLVHVYNQKRDLNFKEWKTPLNLEVHIIKKIYDPTLMHILQWENAKEALEYAKQHNLNLWG